MYSYEACPLFIYSTSLELDFKEITSGLRRKDEEHNRSSI